MARKPDPARVDAARRAGIHARLMAGGMSQEVAERWCGAWEREGKLRDLKRDGDFWDSGGRWIDEQCSLGRRPPN